MKYARMFTVALVSVVAACGGDDDGGGVNLVDANGSGTGDATAAECLAPASLGSPTPTAQEGHYILGDADDDPATPDVPVEFYLFADANQDASPDIVLVDLFLGFGAFSESFAPKTVSITGPEADYWECGACVQLQTDYTAQGQTGTPYQAIGGTVNITSVSTTSIAGTLSNITFQHIDLDTTAQTSQPSADGCMSSLASMSFSAVPEDSTNFTGFKPGKNRLKMRLSH